MTFFHNNTNVLAVVLRDAGTEIQITLLKITSHQLPIQLFFMPFCNQNYPPPR